ncbi:MAG: AI-2E family transporter, partial [Pseudomonadales bacterium]|nr:AI-2E family transporter [Pseudomonadales bacterium]
LQLMTQDFALWLTGMGLEVPQVVWRDYLDPGIAMGFAGQLLASFGNVMANGFLILLTVIFILTEMGMFMRKIHAVANNAHLSEANMNRFIININHYMTIKGWISLATGACITLWLLILGVDYAVLWGVLAFLLNFIPNLGSIIAAVPAVLLALVQIGPGTAALAGTGYLLANIIMGNVIEPRFMGKGLDLSTLVVFLSLVFWGWTLGTVGMLLSIPLTMAVKIALESYDETRWIGVILSSGVPESSGKNLLPKAESEQKKSGA